MSAPDTNLEKQKKRHVPSLVGIGLAAVFGVAMIVALTFIVSARGDDPDGSEVQVDGRTGEIEVTE